MGKLYRNLIIFSSFLIAFYQCIQLPTFANKLLGISSDNNKKIDLCNDLHEHLSNLEIDVLTYSDKDEEFPNNSDSIGVTVIGSNEKPIKLVWTKMEEISKLAKKEFTIFGSDIKAQDIRQGQLNDCYFLTAISGFANNSPDYIRKIFDKQTAQEVSKGIITTNWLINGRPTKVSVDTYIPTTEDKDLIFANIQGDFEFWPIILEKAWAKIYGSYSAIEFGYSDTVYRALSMAPVFHCNHDKMELEELWTILNTVSASSSGQRMHNLVPNHAYNPLSTCEFALKNGTVLRLVKVQNPWAQEVYTGPFRDNDPNWTEDMRKQCDSKISNDGVFFIPVEDYQKAFVETSGAKVIAGYTSEYLISKELQSDFTEREDCYQITVQPSSASASIWVQIHFIDPRFNRQLPEECSIEQDYFSLWIVSENFEVVEKVYDDSDPSFFQKELSGEEKYYVFIKSKVKTQVLKDYVVDVYAPKSSVELKQSKVNKTLLYFDNLKLNKEKGVKAELQQGSNVWMYKNIPITNDQESRGIIFDNQNENQKLKLEITLKVQRMEVVGEGCELVEENIIVQKEKTEERIYKCQGVLYPQEIYPIMLMHMNSYGAWYFSYSYSYTLLHHGNDCFDYELSSSNSEPYPWEVKLGQNYYDCDWFSVNPTVKCNNYGEIQGKGGKSANEICCSCGSGANEQLALMVGEDETEKRKHKLKKQSVIAISSPQESKFFNGIVEKVSGIIYKKSR